MKTPNRFIETEAETAIRATFEDARQTLAVTPAGTITDGVRVLTPSEALRRLLRMVGDADSSMVGDGWGALADALTSGLADAVKVDPSLANN